MKLAKTLELCEKDNVITAEQKARILAADAEDFHTKITVIVSYFAAFLIGLGFISVVAANWNDFTKLLQFGLAFAGLVLNAGIIFYARLKNKKNVLRIATFIFAFMLMAVMGLTAQIYNLPADIDASCLFWSSISFTLLFLLPELIWIWLPAAFIGLNDLSPYLPFFHNLQIQLGEILLLVLSYEVCAGLKKEYLKPIVSALRFYSGLLLSGITALDYSAVLLEQNAVFYITALIAVISLNVIRKRVSFMPLFLLISLLPLYSKDMADVLFCLTLGAYAYYHKTKRIFSLAIALLILKILVYYVWRTFGLFNFGLNMIIIGAVLLLTIYLSKKYINRLWEIGK
jgi:hypothetical protein